MAPRQGLFRIVRQPDGVVVLEEGPRVNGRGAYVCRDVNCVRTAARRGAFQRALRHAVHDEVLTRLAEKAAVLVEASEGAKQASNSGEEFSHPDR
jgi:predicted RNA-binding protein YlxR (DUF448 family)